MSRINNTYFGVPSGRIGDVIYVRRRGKLYAYAYNANVQVSQSEKSLISRGRFTFASQAGSTLNRIPVIRDLWKNPDDPYAVPYNRMVGNIAKQAISENDISGLKFLPPGESMSIVLNNATSEGNIITAEITITGCNNPVSAVFNPELTAQGIMLLTEPSADIPDYALIPLCSTHSEFIQGQPLRFRIPVVDKDLIQYLSYSRKRFVLNLILTDTKGNPEFYSDYVNGEMS